MQKILDTIDRVSTFLAILVFLPWVIVLILNIVMRQFSSGLVWYMEVAQYSNIWVVMTAMVGVCASNDHLRIDAMEMILKGKPKRFLRLLIALLTVAFLIILGYALILLASRARQVIATIPTIRISYVYWPLPVLCFLSAISCLLHGIWDFVSFGNENQAPASE